MNLLDSSNDSGENEVLFMKIGARVLDLCRPWHDAQAIAHAHAITRTNRE